VNAPLVQGLEQCPWSELLTTGIAQALGPVEHSGDRTDFPWAGSSHKCSRPAKSWIKSYGRCLHCYI